MGYEKHGPDEMGICACCHKDLWWSVRTYESRYEPALEPPDYDSNISEARNNICDDCDCEISDFLSCNHKDKNFDDWYISKKEGSEEGILVLHFSTDPEEVSLGEVRELLKASGRESCE